MISQISFFGAHVGKIHRIFIIKTQSLTTFSKGKSTTISTVLQLPINFCFKPITFIEMIIIHHLNLIFPACPSNHCSLLFEILQICYVNVVYYHVASLSLELWQTYPVLNSHRCLTQQNMESSSSLHLSHHTNLSHSACQNQDYLVLFQIKIIYLMKYQNQPEMQNEVHMDSQSLKSKHH